MQFQLSEEQKLIRQTVREFAEKEIKPGTTERDEQEHFDPALMFDKIGELV